MGYQLSAFIVGLFTKQEEKSEFILSSTKTAPFFERNTPEVVFGCVIIKSCNPCSKLKEQLDKCLNELKLGVLHSITIQK